MAWGKIFQRFWGILQDMNLGKILIFSYTLTPLHPFAQSTNSTVLNLKMLKQLGMGEKN